jgi:tripartite-type tricarboxylate transporter receptor subunit TctC
MIWKTHWMLRCVVLLGLLVGAPARGEDYPSRTITIVVSLAAGSGMDAITRLYAEKLSESFGKPVIVENKPGAATTLAANQVAKAAPDGYTLVVLTSIALAINPTLFKTLNYDVQDFTPISLYVKSPFILVVDPALPVKTLAEFVELARKANPPLNYASIGTGSVQHMSMELAKKQLGFDATHVPYRSTPQSVTDLMGGHVAASFLEAGLSIPLIREGKLRALAVSSAQRLPLLPDVPPFAEASGIADYEGVSWHMLLVPAKDAAADHRPASCGNEAHHAGLRDARANLGAWPDPERLVLDRRHAQLYCVRTTEMGCDGETARARGHAVGRWVCDRFCFIYDVGAS